MILPLKPASREEPRYDPKEYGRQDDGGSSSSSVTSVTASVASEEEESSSNLSIESSDFQLGKVNFDLDVIEYPPREDMTCAQIKATWLCKKDLVLARHRAIRDCVMYQQASEYREAVNTLRRKLPYMVVDMDGLVPCENADTLQDDEIFSFDDETAKEAAVQTISRMENARGLERLALGLGSRKEHIFCVLETQSMLLSRPFEERAEAIAEASRSISQNSFDLARSLGAADANDVLHDKEDDTAMFTPHCCLRIGAHGRLIQSVEL